MNTLLMQQNNIVRSKFRLGLIGVWAACGLLSACGGGAASTSSTPASEAAALSTNTLALGNTALSALATSLSNSPTTKATISLSKLAADDANGCDANSGSAGVVLNSDDYTIKDVLCRMTVTASTARKAVPKVLNTSLGIFTALATLGLSYDNKDHPGTYTLRAGGQSFTKNFDQLTLTSPAKFDGVEHPGFAYGVEFNMLGDTGQYWRIAFTQDGEKIKWASNQEKNTQSDKSGEGYELGYIETNVSTGELRMEQIIYPNKASTLGTLFKQAIYAKMALNGSAFTTDFPLDFAYAFSGGNSASQSVTAAQKVNGKQLINVRDYAIQNGSAVENVARAKCGKLVGDAPVSCSERLQVANDILSWLPSSDSDEKSWEIVKTSFNNTTSKFSDWKTPAVITSSSAQ